MGRIAIWAGLAALLAGVFWWAGGRSSGGAARELPPVTDPDSRRSPPAGELVGFVGRYGSHVWLGIPYAKAPSGARRWRVPEAAEPWSGAREATAFGAHCPQLASPFAGVEGEPGSVSGSEDCLFLNVYAPRLPAPPPAGERLPVMVWIHGGGHVVGRSDAYDGGLLAERERVVVVTLNYRLGPLGWLRHAALREADASPAERSGNFGTLDLMRALGWVRDNIAAFGGDPSRVTVFGESAGGTNVYTLLLSPLAAGLFQRAIVQSGGTAFASVAEAESWSDAAEPGHPHSSNEMIAKLMIADGSAPDRAAARARIAKLSPRELATYLRGKSPAELFAVHPRDREAAAIEVPKLFADGAVLPVGDPLERLARADGWNRVPVITGTNRDENKAFLIADPTYARRWLGVIPSVRDPDRYLATADAMSAMWKATGADGPAAAMKRHQPQVFVYRFDWDEEPTRFGFDVARYVGAAHGFEIPFVFGHWDLGRHASLLFTDENAPGREALSAAMMSYWASFAYTGDPARGRRGELPAWTAWDGRPGEHNYAILDTPAGGGPRMGSEPVTVTSVLASVDEDPRLASQRERCGVYRELARWSRGFDERDYPSAGREGCAAFPIDAFPWE